MTRVKHLNVFGGEKLQMAPIFIIIIIIIIIIVVVVVIAVVVLFWHLLSCAAALLSSIGLRKQNSDKMIKKGSYQFLAIECVQYWLTA